MSKKALVAAAVCLTALVALCGCEPKKEEHAGHEFSYYIIEVPTCTKDGKMEQTCTVCGKKEIVTLEKLNHDYENGVCTRCGARQYVDVDEDKKSLFYTVDSVVASVSKWKTGFTSEYVLQNINYLSFGDLYIGANGRLKTRIGKRSESGVNGLYVDIGRVKKDYYIVTNGKLGTIKELSVQGCHLFVYDAAGTMTDAGFLTAYTPTSSGIEGLLINNQNVLIGLYADDTIKALGVIPSKPADETKSDLMFYNRAGNDYYFVHGMVNGNSESVTIPETHFGKPVVAVSSDAFAGDLNLKSADLSVDNITIYAAAFRNCLNLKSVVLPANFRIFYQSFYGCNSLSEVYYEGTVEGWREIDFAEGNDTLLSSTVYYYSETKPIGKGNYWRYSNGKPAKW